MGVAYGVSPCVVTGVFTLHVHYEFGNLVITSLGITRRDRGISTVSVVFRLPQAEVYPRVFALAEGNRPMDFATDVREYCREHFYEDNLDIVLRWSDEQLDRRIVYVLCVGLAGRAE